MGDRPLKIAYVADGKLFVHDDGGEPRLIESPFVENLLERAQRDRERNAWKEDSLGWNINSSRGMPFGGLAGARAAGPPRRIQITGLASGPGGELVYALDTSVTAGLFAQTVADRSERRVFHKQGFRARDLTRRRSDGALAMSLRNDDGSASIGVMAADGRGIRPCTEGDVVDEQPSWIDGGEGLVYQSAGIGRNQAGMHVMLGPYSVVRLDTATQNVETLLEDNRFDFLAPRLASGGVLYYIRRPYQPIPPVSPWKVCWDLVAFPYRVARALVHFLDFFSMMFARKPLITAGGPPRQGPDQRYMMLWGKMIDAEKAMRDKRAGGSLVPREWTLVRRDLASRQETELAKGVLSFDLSPDGGVVYNNGTHVFRRWPDGREDRILSAKMIERVVVVE